MAQGLLAKTQQEVELRDSRHHHLGYCWR